MRRAGLWKLLGVAGLAGVAATGVVVARGERRRQQLSPEQVRERLLERHAGSAAPTAPAPPAPPAPPPLAPRDGRAGTGDLPPT